MLFTRQCFKCCGWSVYKTDHDKYIFQKDVFRFFSTDSHVTAGTMKHNCKNKGQNAVFVVLAHTGVRLW